MADEKCSFELRKGMNIVKTRYPRSMTRMDMKFIHLIQVQLKKWTLDNDYQPSNSLTGIEAYEGVKTSFSFPIEDLSLAIGSNRSALNKIIKDDKNKTVYRNGFPLRRITEYLTSAVNITIEIDSQYVTGAISPISTAIYFSDTNICHIETNQTMAAILLDAAFEKNSSFVDMQLQMKLKSLMACHILDRISRFKTVTVDYKCTIRSLVDECGLDIDKIQNRHSFINTNIREPLKQIELLSDGIWSRTGKGFEITKKSKGLTLDDVVTFKMVYNDKLENVSSKNNNYDLSRIDSMTDSEMNNEVMLLISAIENKEDVDESRFNAISALSFKLLSEGKDTFEMDRYITSIMSKKTK
ncbi:hypothetical protein [Photobacterium carnosum]|uniref:hypothetical protein n=1 Tax=Photobacterium carnosum TaxID=2023717 RepID=UPI001E5D5E70|nr:hypothetical protein [Photobacterium carnosum]MCD9527855.1 hypothetical protein [Photobacterium carnosum]